MTHTFKLARRTARFRTPLAALLLLPLFGACDTEHTTSLAPESATPSEPVAPALSTALAAAPSSCSSSSYTRLVKVASAGALSAALSNAQPGDLIVLADGTYRGSFKATRSGTAERPITVCGSSNAVLNGGSLTSGFGLHLNTADDWKLIGFTVTNSMKGLILEYANHNTLQGLTIHDVGSAGIHIRRFSSDNVLRASHIYRTGRNDYQGEGVYVGTSSGSWPSYTNGQPDASNRNQLLDNRIEQTTAEGIEVKEGTRGTVVTGNHIANSGRQQSSTRIGATGSIATRGGRGTFSGNIIQGCYSTCPKNGMEVYAGGGAGDGDYNVFRDNILDVQNIGYGIKVTDPANQIKNVVGCDNVVRNATKNLTNVSCQ